MSFTDLVLLPHPTLTNHFWRLMTFGAKPCHILRNQPSGESREFFFFNNTSIIVNIVFLGNGRISLTWIKQFIEIWFWPYLFNTSDLHHILCSLILEAQTGQVISSCKTLMCKKLIKGFFVLFVHSNITIIHDIIWKTTILKKYLKKAPSKEKKEIIWLFALRR